MKVEGRLFIILAVFMAVVTPAYWFLSGDPTGTTALALTFGLCFMVAFYLTFTGKRLDGIRPSDDEGGEIADAAGELGFYSPHSWWPLACAASGAVLFLGVIFGIWLFLIGLVMAVWAVTGMVFEYYRGVHAH